MWYSPIFIPCVHYYVFIKINSRWESALGLLQKKVNIILFIKSPKKSGSKQQAIREHLFTRVVKYLKDDKHKSFYLVLAHSFPGDSL